MKKQTNQLLYLLLTALAVVSISACDNEEAETCGNIDLLFDEVRYEVNTCEAMNFRNGCEYTIDYLDLCFEEGGREYCQQVSIAFVSYLNEGEYEIVHPDVLTDLAPGDNLIAGYIGGLQDDGTLVPIKYMESGKLIVTEVNLTVGTVTGSFEFKVVMGDEDAKPMEASATFQNVRW